jgi:hypothetical protein
MSGCYGGLHAFIHSKSPETLWTHCIIHRKAFASKYLSPTLNKILEYVANVVNFIKTWPLKARFFKKLSEDIDPNTHLCCSTALRVGFLVVMSCLIHLNSDFKRRMLLPCRERFRIFSFSKCHTNMLVLPKNLHSQNVRYICV